MNLLLSNKNGVYHYIDKFEKISKNKICIRISGTLNFDKILNFKKYMILSNNRKYFKVYHIKNIEVGEIKEFDISNRNVVIKVEVTIEFDKKKTIGNTNLKTLYKIYNRKVSLSNILKDI